MTDEKDTEMEKYAAFCSLITETEVVVSVDQTVAGVILPKILMESKKSVDLIVSLANDPNTIADEEGFCSELPTGFQVVIPWEAVYRIEDLHSDEDVSEYYWTDDDPGTKEFVNAFDETVEPEPRPTAAIEATMAEVNALMDRIQASYPRDPEKPPLPVKVVTGEKAQKMAETLQAAHQHWKSEQEKKEKREALKKTLQCLPGRDKTSPPTEPRTGHLKLVKNDPQT